MAVKINQSVFMLTFAADASYHAHLEGHETYLVKKSGTLIYAISDRERVAREIGLDVVEDMLDSDFCNEHPEKYLEIPSMSHGEHHSVLQDFLISNWSTEQARLDHASGIYYSRKSIGYWLKNVGDQDAIDAYFGFREVGNLRLAEKFLRENGISEFEWA